jgi:endonuclease YncB( thermonuclease family)
MWEFFSLLLASFLLSASASAEEIIGRVVGVADGDTLTILVNGHEQIKVRLAEIDAPEKAQPFGQQSKQSLSDLCFGKNAVLQKTDTDRYGRTVAKVYCAGVYANAEQIRIGLAWAYRKYLHDQSLLDLENEARTAKRGYGLIGSQFRPRNTGS